VLAAGFTGRMFGTHLIPAAGLRAFLNARGVSFSLRNQWISRDRTAQRRADLGQSAQFATLWRNLGLK